MAVGGVGSWWLATGRGARDALSHVCPALFTDLRHARPINLPWQVADLSGGLFEVLISSGGTLVGGEGLLRLVRSDG